MLGTTWSRLRPLLPVLLGLLVSMAVINLVMSGIDRLFPRWLPAVVAGGGYLETNFARVSAARDEVASEAGGGPPVVALLGLSGARECMSVRHLEELDGAEARYIALCGAGGAVGTTSSLASPLFDLGVVPDLALIGVSPHLLIEPPPPSEVVRPTFAERVRRRGWIEVARTVAEWAWFRSRRADLSGNWNELTAEARRWFMRSMGAPVRVDGVDPWGELLHADWPERATSATRQGMLDGYESRGCFDPERYSEDPAVRQVASLRDLITRLASRGTRVLVYFVPESSELRARIPAEGLEALRAAVPVDPNGLVDVIDFREALDDEEFIEVSHPNRAGKRRFSEIIAPEIGRRLPTAPDPTS